MELNQFLTGTRPDDGTSAGIRRNRGTTFEHPVRDHPGQRHPTPPRHRPPDDRRPRAPAQPAPHGRAREDSRGLLHHPPAARKPLPAQPLASPSAACLRMPPKSTPTPKPSPMYIRILPARVLTSEKEYTTFTPSAGSSPAASRMKDYSATTSSKANMSAPDWPATSNYSTISPGPISGTASGYTGGFAGIGRSLIGCCPASPRRMDDPGQIRFRDLAAGKFLIICGGALSRLPT